MTERRLRPVSRNRHGGTYWHRPEGYGHLRGHRLISVGLNDVARMAAAFPIVFRAFKDQHGVQFAPAVLLRIAIVGTTPFVSSQGQWRAAQLPPGAHTHPFDVTETQDGQMVLLVDEGSACTSDDPQGEPFFSADGSLSPALQSMVSHFADRRAAADVAQTACAALHALGLFVPLADAAEFDQDSGLGLFMLDASRSAQLSQDNILSLHRDNALGLLYGHRTSMAHCAWLALAERGAEASPAKTIPPKVTSTTDRAARSLTSFLDSVARDRETELLWPGLVKDASV